MMPDAPAPTALKVLEMARAGRFADISERFAPQLRPMVPAEALQTAWDVEMAQLGPVSSVGAPVSETTGTVTVVKVPVTSERGGFTLVVSVTEDGWLAGLRLAPPSAAQPTEPWRPPDYADVERFSEEEVTIGTGPLAVPGTLSLPRPAPGPAVVLLSGSGPQDRDETIGQNKPLRDLAWGLASRGIAVLRFDKVTFAHGRQVAQDRDFTVADEYIPDAVAAVGLLRQHPAVDADRVFVLGHSLGGTVAPRVALAEPAIAGLVILAGGVQPLYWAAVRQTRYLASLAPDTAASAQPAIEAMSRQAAMADSPDLSPSTPDHELPFGVPAPYWLDLRGYDPAAAAATLRQPMLIVQGGRDYQVTEADDLARWEASLAGRPDVTIRVYSADNHLFFRGTGKSSPAEYEPPQHVDPAVVADVADWLLMTRSA
jgi:dienelactone hydrolase